MAKELCPIWQTYATLRPSRRDGQEVDSPRCGGRYFISGTATVNLGRWDDALRGRLTTWLINQRRLGVECPEITSHILDDIEGRYSLGVQERAQRLLEYFERESNFIGDEVAFNRDEISFMEMLAWSESILSEEVEYLLSYLQRRNFIEWERVGDSSGTVVIAMDGYVHLASLREKVSRSEQVFVAMWFDETMVSAYDEGIAPAIRDAGFDPVRIDRKEHNNKIDDEIIAEIRRSRFVVSDFTHGAAGARGGVYYEAGFAQGLDMPVIFTCRIDMIDKVHFDTRQYNHITWSTPEELRERLAKRISATLGDGPLRRIG